MALPRTIGFIGGGNMGTTIIAGLRTVAHPPTIAVADTAPAIRARHAANGCQVETAIAPVLSSSEVIVLAVKPQIAAQVLPELAKAITARHLVISILAGTPLAKLEGGLPPGSRVIRAMPNTPMAIGKGMVGFARGRHATAEDAATARDLFATCATVLEVEESRLDAITAVSGSGPAYVYRFAESLLAAAMDLGFDRDQAATLVGCTLEGSVAYLLAQEGFPAARLRQEVTSPGGTTAAALGVLDAAGFEALIRQALAAACRRAGELAGK